MTSFSTFAQTNPVADNTPAPGIFGKAANAVKGYFGGIGNTISSNAQEAGHAIIASGAGQENPFAAGATVFKDIAGVAASPITGLINPIANATGVTGGLNKISQGFVNSSVGQATTNALSKFPQASGAVADTLQGAMDTGAVAGGIDELKAPEGNIWAKVKGTPVDTTTSRIADATPAYDKNLIGQNTRTPEGQIVPRVNEGTGLMGKRTVNTSAAEAEQGQELNNLPNYPDKGTALEKSIAVGKGIGTEAEAMRAGLKAEDQATPLDTQTEITKVQNLVKSNLPEEIHSKLGVLSPEEESMIKGMNDKIGLPNKGPTDLSSPSDRLLLPKTATGRYYGKVLDALKEYDGTREGKLNLRQKIEKAFQSEGGKYAYGSDSHNALAETNTDIRNALNKDLADSSKNTDTHASLKKQTNLYRAQDTLEAKAKDEAASQIGRFYQNHPLLHRLATRDFMRLAAQATGVGLLGTYISKALQGKQ